MLPSMRSHQSLILGFIGCVQCIFCSRLGSMLPFWCPMVSLDVGYPQWSQHDCKCTVCSALCSSCCLQSFGWLALHVHMCLPLRSLQRIYTWALGISAQFSCLMCPRFLLLQLQQTLITAFSFYQDLCAPLFTTVNNYFFGRNLVVMESSMEVHLSLGATVLQCL